MKKLSRHALLALVTVALGIGSAYAQSTETPRIDQREANQQKRIDQGVQSGKLTDKEAQTLQRRQDRINATEAKAKSDGQVTGKERRQIKRMQNRNNRAIQRKKHNARDASSPS